MKIYVDTVRRFCRPKNTDWQYNFVLSNLSSYDPSLEFVYPDSTWQELRVNGRYLFNAAAYRLASRSRTFNRWHRESFVDRLDSCDLKRSGCRLVFSHRDFPLNAGDIPVVWQNSILDPAMTLARGSRPDMLAEEFRIKRDLFSRARLVQVSSLAEEERLANAMPEIGDRFRAVPFFLPYLQAIEEAAVGRKHANGEMVEFVFVGREARRKGLPEVLAALFSLNFGRLSGARLTIVSDFRDGPVSLPDWPNLKHELSLERREVAELFDRSHVLLMPSRFESYGFVYLEAMSRGVVPVVPDWEVQREIVAGGNCGRIVSCHPDSIANAVVELLDDARWRRDLAIRARQRFLDEYSPAVVAKRYAKLFNEAVG